MKPRAKPVPATQQARDRIANEVASGRLTIDQAHTELDRLERPPGVPLSNPDDEPDWAEAAEGLAELQEHLDSKPITFGGVPLIADPDYPEDRVPMLVNRPSCFEPRTGLKHEMVNALDAIQLRTVLAARMVR